MYLLLYILAVKLRTLRGVIGFVLICPLVPSKMRGINFKTTSGIAPLVAVVFVITLSEQKVVKWRKYKNRYEVGLNKEEKYKHT